MTLPLIEYINASILIETQGVGINIVNGRHVVSAGKRILVQLYLPRYDATGRTSGSFEIDLGGVNGREWIFRGYALRRTEVPNDFILGKSDESVYTYEELTDYVEYLRNDQECKLRFGRTDTILDGKIVQAAGKYGADGIDKLSMPELGLRVEIIAGAPSN